jgi:hypothetical protein
VWNGEEYHVPEEVRKWGHDSTERNQMKFSFLGQLIRLPISPPQAAVTLDVSPQASDCRTITSYLRLVGANDISGSAMPLVKGQAFSVMLQLILFLPEPLFVGPQVAR